MNEVLAECSSCNGTGLYRGFAEREGVAVVCVVCNGTGCTKLRYKPFVKRHGRRDVKYVHRSKGMFIGTGVGPSGGRVSYEEFEKGRMP